MSIPEKYLSTFEENATYHVYNRTNNHELLFKSEKNYQFFLKQYRKYLYPFVESFAYCLLPNHFHFIIKVRAIKEMEGHLQSLSSESLIKAEKLFLEQPEKISI